METLQERIDKIKWLRNLLKTTSPNFYEYYKSYKLSKNEALPQSSWQQQMTAV